jgi:hypothetical protein
VFLEMLNSANVKLLHNSRITKVQLSTLTTAKSIDVITTTDGSSFRAAVFIDGTYEGALMKLTGAVTYTWGREANSTYNESAAGRLPNIATPWPFGDRASQLPHGINPYTDSTNTTLIQGVWGGGVAAVGAGDDRVAAYDWRTTLTTDVENMVPIPSPAQYDPAEFELLRRAMKQGWKSGGPSMQKFPDGQGGWRAKSDWKMFKTFGEHANAQWGYPNGTWQEQQDIVQEYKRYAIALIHFFRVDSSVPPELRAKMAAVGLCKDEYNRTADHWMPQLYIRSALRLVGERVLTQQDVVSNAWRGAGVDGIGVGSYTVDVPGPVQVVVERGEVVNEGVLKVPYFCDPSQAPYPLPYSIMVPKRTEMTNLLVPVAVSASHIAFNAVRMEPQWMVLGQSAGVAAAMAVKEAVAADGIRVGADPNAASASEGARRTESPVHAVVAAVNVTALQQRLRVLGQLLEPRPPAPSPPTPPPGPSPPGPSPGPVLSGDEWYAWKQMWNVTAAGMLGSGTSSVAIVANRNASVLKRSYASSSTLPPAEVRFYDVGAQVALKATPQDATDAKYWLVHVERVN